MASPPQFDAPFRLDHTGREVTVPQDTPQEIGAAIYNIVTCPQGAKLGDPEFGLPSPLFSSIPLNTDQIVKAVQASESRATVAAVQETLRQVQSQQPVTVDITAQVTGP